jgi:hypothetical protein
MSRQAPQSPSIDDWLQGIQDGSWIKPAKTIPEIDAKWKIEIRGNGKIERVAKALASHSQLVARKHRIELEKKRRLAEPDIFWKGSCETVEPALDAHVRCALYKPTSFRKPSEARAVVDAFEHLKFFQTVSEEQVDEDMIAHHAVFTKA